jgi:hypothetical protein
MSSSGSVRLRYEKCLQVWGNAIVYSGAPSTNYKAYTQAQKALKELEDMTFSDDEIDAFLPTELKRKQP